MDVLIEVSAVIGAISIFGRLLELLAKITPGDADDIFMGKVNLGIRNLQNVLQYPIKTQKKLIPKP